MQCGRPGEGEVLLDFGGLSHTQGEEIVGHLFIERLVWSGPMWSAERGENGTSGVTLWLAYMQQG